MDTNPLRPDACLLLGLLLSGGSAQSTAEVRKALRTRSGGAVVLPDAVVYPARDRLVEERLLRLGAIRGRSQALALTKRGQEHAATLALAVRAIATCLSPDAIAAVAAAATEQKKRAAARRPRPVLPRSPAARAALAAPPKVSTPTPSPAPEPEPEAIAAPVPADPVVELDPAAEVSPAASGAADEAGKDRRWIEREDAAGAKDDFSQLPPGRRRR